MLKKILKVTGIVVGIIVVFIVGFYMKAYISTKNRLGKAYDVQPQALVVSHDSAMLATGKRLAAVKGCTECHGEDLGGKVMNEDFALGLLVAGNLTR